jgi:hypothetical protein
VAMLTHQPDEGVFRSVLAEDIDRERAKSGEYVTQVTAAGPISLEYVDPSDDPRNE